MKSAGENMDIIAAYQQVGTYVGPPPCAVPRIRRSSASSSGRRPAARRRTACRVVTITSWSLSWSRTGSRPRHGRISAKRLLPAARAAGYAGSARNFRRLVADAKKAWRREHHRGRRPAVWTPGEVLAIDWGSAAPARVLRGAGLVTRPVRAVRRQRARRDHAGDAGGVLRGARRGPEGGAGGPDGLPEGRRGREQGRARPRTTCVSPRHYAFRPDWCEAADPESKGIVENLVGYAKRDLIVPQAPFNDLAAANVAARSGAPRSTACRTRRSARSRPSGWSAERDLLRRAAVVAAGASAGPRVTTEGRPALLHPVRLGPLLGAHAPDRRACRRRSRPAGGCWWPTPRQVRSSPSHAPVARARHRS